MIKSLENGNKKIESNGDSLTFMKRIFEVYEDGYTTLVDAIFLTNVKEVILAKPEVSKVEEVVDTVVDTIEDLLEAVSDEVVDTIEDLIEDTEEKLKEVVDTVVEKSAEEKAALLAKITQDRIPRGQGENPNPRKPTKRVGK